MLVNFQALPVNLLFTNEVSGKSHCRIPHTPPQNYLIIREPRRCQRISYTINIHPYEESKACSLVNEQVDLFFAGKHWILDALNPYNLFANRRGKAAEVFNILRGLEFKREQGTKIAINSNCLNFMDLTANLLRFISFGVFIFTLSYLWANFSSL